MDDLISRQDLITSFRLDDDCKAWSMDDLIYRIEQFPSAQPEDTIEMQESDIDEAMKLVRDARVTTRVTILPSAQPESESAELLSGKVWDEWCTDCKEYDHERHCCPRFRDVIFSTVDELTDNAYIEGYTAAEAKYREGLQDAER